jgi:hypothetical protein
MELAEAVADLVRRHGSSLLDDPRTFRGALDDYLDEDAGSVGLIRLLTDAVEQDALRSLIAMLDNGADLDSAIVSVGDRLARDRGSSDVDGARWACAVLGYAVGRVPAHVEERLRDRADLHSSSSPTTAPATTVPQPGPAQSPPVGPSVPDRSRRWPVAAVVAVCVATVVAVGAIVAAVLLVGRDDEGGADPSEEVAEETAFTAAPSGTEVRLRLSHSGSAAALVKDVMRDGDFERVDEVTLSCEYWPGSTNPDLTADQDVEGLPPRRRTGHGRLARPRPAAGLPRVFRVERSGGHTPALRLRRDLSHRGMTDGLTCLR